MLRFTALNDSPGYTLITLIDVTCLSDRNRWAAPVSQRSWVRFPFKPEFFQVSSFRPLRLEHLHCDDLHVILSLSVQAWIFFQVSSLQPLRLEHLHCDDLHIILTYNMLAASLWHECCVWKMINIRPICLKMHRGPLFHKKYQLKQLITKQPEENFSPEVFFRLLFYQLHKLISLTVMVIIIS